MAPQRRNPYRGQDLLARRARSRQADRGVRMRMCSSPPIMSGSTILIRACVVPPAPMLGNTLVLTPRCSPVQLQITPGLAARGAGRRAPGHGRPGLGPGRTVCARGAHAPGRVGSGGAASGAWGKCARGARLRGAWRRTARDRVWHRRAGRKADTGGGGVSRRYPPAHRVSGRRDRAGPGRGGAHVEFLRGQPAQEIFARYGFSAPPR